MRLRLRGGVTVGFDCNSERAVDDAPSLITISGRPGFILGVIEIRAPTSGRRPADAYKQTTFPVRRYTSRFRY